MQHLNVNDTYESFNGFIQILKCKSETSEIVEIVNTPNLVTFVATNILARCLSGDSSFKISLFRAGGKTGAASIPAGTPTREDEDLEVMTAFSGDSPVIVEFPAIAPSFTGSTSPTNTKPNLQYSNLVTFTGIMPSQGSFIGKHFHEAGIYSEQGSEKLLFAHQFHNPILSEAGYNLIYNWSFKFV